MCHIHIYIYLLFCQSLQGSATKMDMDTVKATIHKIFIKPRMVYMTCKEQLIIQQYFTIFKIVTLFSY